MSHVPFQPSLLGGPWARRLHPRRAWIDDLPWDEPWPDDAEAASWSWTQTAFSEYASAAAFAEIAAALAAAGAPIDLIAAAGDFVVDEIVHVEASARIAAALGGGVMLEVDLTRLVRPSIAEDPRMRAAELLVRTSCVGEALTVPLLKLARELSGSTVVAAAIRRIVQDEALHAQIGGWFLDWADTWLDDAGRSHLGEVAGVAVRAFAPLLGNAGCSASGMGVLACDRYDPLFIETVERRVAMPLAARGIEIPTADLRVVGVGV
jgi:hypothetical protein